MNSIEAVKPLGNRLGPGLEEPRIGVLNGNIGDSLESGAGGKIEGGDNRGDKLVRPWHQRR